MTKPFVNHLVVDAAAFIKNAKIEEYGQHIYSLKCIIDEIRDRATRERLQVLPYDLDLREPTAASIATVTEVSKKTGDFATLSANDLRLAALVYELEVQEAGSNAHINLNPQIQVTFESRRKPRGDPSKIAGFFYPKKKTTENIANNDCGSVDGSVPEEQEEELADNLVRKCVIRGDAPQKSNLRTCDETEGQKLEKTEDRTGLTEPEAVDRYSLVELNENNNHIVHGNNTAESDIDDDGDNDTNSNENSDGHDTENENDDRDDDDETGWITTDNLKETLERMGGAPEEPVDEENIGVACLTTDFAVQNVLLHMGLHIVSLDGMLVRRLKSYVFRCHGCFKITKNMSKKFCWNCGNATLDRVSVTVNTDGSMAYHLSRRKPTTTRGLRYSLPKPEGGKFAQNPVLCPDQPRPRLMLSGRAREKLDVFDEDYLNRDSPFLMNDVYSRSARLGIRLTSASGRRQNPNEWKGGKKRGGKRR
jgi:RNA-binding protein NOB1